MLETVLEEEEGEKEEMPLFNLLESEYVSKSISTQTDPKLTCHKNHIGCHADIKVEMSILFYISPRQICPHNFVSLRGQFCAILTTKQQRVVSGRD